jgi:hypothetical protein
MYNPPRVTITHVRMVVGAAAASELHSIRLQEGHGNG